MTTVLATYNYISCACRYADIYAVLKLNAIIWLPGDQVATQPKGLHFRKKFAVEACTCGFLLLLLMLLSLHHMWLQTSACFTTCAGRSQGLARRWPDF